MELRMFSSDDGFEELDFKVRSLAVAKNPQCFHWTEAEDEDEDGNPIERVFTGPESMAMISEMEAELEELFH
jgi:hypothetical protein